MDRILMMVWVVIGLGVMAEPAASSTGDAEPTGILGDVLDDLLGDKDKDKDKDGEDDPKDDPAPADDAPRRDPHRHDDGGPDVPYHKLSDAERHVIQFIPFDGDRMWEHGKQGYKWEWKKQNVRGKIRFELWKGRRKLAELRPPIENDGRGKFPDPVPEAWGSGRNYYIVAIDGRGQIGMTGPFTIYGGVLVLSPSDLTVWQTDAAIGEVLWDKRTAQGNSVKIDLYRGDKFVAELKRDVPNDGEAVFHRAKVLEAWGGGEGYRIRVTDARGRGGFSNAFRINAGVTVIYPDKHARWVYPQKGAQVRWDKNTARSERVTIELWRGDDKVAVLKDRVPNDGRADLDGVDPKWGTGEGFHVRVIDGRGKAGLSEAFSITGEIEIVQPNRATVWRKGDKRVALKWKQSSASDRIAFELWTADKKKKVRDFMGPVKNDGFGYRNDGIDFDVEQGQYRIRAVDANGYVGWSEPFPIRDKK